MLYKCEVANFQFNYGPNADPNKFNDSYQNGPIP